jgi:hypothetical protein
MATLGNSYKVSGAVAATSSGSATLYTAPASGFAIINVYCSAASQTVSVGGQQIFAAPSGGGALGPVYVGPSQAVECVAGGNPVRISGVAFTNA